MKKGKALVSIKTKAVVSKTHPQIDLGLPGRMTPTGWAIPRDLSIEEYLACWRALAKIETGHQWWMGDLWNYGQDGKGHKYGTGQEIADRLGKPYATLKDYGAVAAAFEFSERSENLTWSHHWLAYQKIKDKAERLRWLARAEGQIVEGNPWSASKFKSQIARARAIDATQEASALSAEAGRWPVLYADPPWRYENPPVGGSNRSIENHYPTMTIEELCVLPVANIAHDNSTLYLWTTSPKLSESLQVVEAWGFGAPRTTAVWVKDKIGMGYYFREQHELLLVCKRGELPPPDETNRPPSVIMAPRGKHSEKPAVVYDLLDQMYPKIRKIELFNRGGLKRKHWTAWGNQAISREAAE